MSRYAPVTNTGSELRREAGRAAQDAEAAPSAHPGRTWALGTRPQQGKVTEAQPRAALGTEPSHRESGSP